MKPGTVECAKEIFLPFGEMFGRPSNAGFVVRRSGSPPAKSPRYTSQLLSTTLTST